MSKFCIEPAGLGKDSLSRGRPYRLACNGLRLSPLKKSSLEGTSCPTKMGMNPSPCLAGVLPY